MIVALVKTGKIDVTQLMSEAQCDFQYLAPIIASIATKDKLTR